MSKPSGWETSGLFLGKPLLPVRWLPTAVHDGKFQNAMIRDGIENGVRKAFGKATSNVFVNHTIKKWILSNSFNRTLYFSVERQPQWRACLGLIECSFFELSTCLWVEWVRHLSSSSFRTLFMTSLPGIGLTWPLLTSSRKVWNDLPVSSRIKHMAQGGQNSVSTVGQFSVDISNPL